MMVLENKSDSDPFNLEIKISEFVSPNGDGINDFFEIQNIENHPNNELLIYTRSGVVIFLQETTETTGVALQTTD